MPENNENLRNGWRCIEHGSYIEAMAFFKAAAEEGCPSGLTCLAGMHEEGLGCEVDIEKAIKLLHAAADLEDAEALSRLGFFYATGRFVEQNFGAAVEYHKRAASQDCAPSQCDLGRHYAPVLA